MNDNELHRIGDLLEQILSELREDTFLSMDEAAKYCGCSVRTVLEWRKKEYVRTAVRGRRKGVMKSDLDRMIG